MAFALLPAAIQFVALLATSTRYGFHRDELYFVVAGSHPALGYPDQPPLVPLLSHALYSLDPGSPFLLRLPSAFVAAATTVLAALIAREVGGGRRAQLIASACTASAGFALAVGHFVTTTTLDLLATTLFLWLAIRALVRRSGRALLAAGVVVGLGFEAKPQVGVVAAVAGASLLATGPRWPFRSPWTLGGVVAAVAIAAPYLVWQQQHGWPQVTVAGNVGGTAEGGRIGFIPFQLLLVSPVLVPVWVAGLLAPFRREGLRVLRFVPVTYVALGLLYLAGQRQGVLPGEPLSAAARAGSGACSGVDAAVASTGAAAGGRGCRVSGGQCGDRAAAAAGAVVTGERRDRDQPRPGRDGRVAAVRRRGDRGVARDPCA